MSWSIQQQVATFCSSGHSFQLRLGSPASGIDRLQCFGKDLPVRPFRLAWTTATDSHRVEEAYVRGNELVVAYEMGPDEEVRPQIVWRVACEPTRVTLDVTIAMQTPYLDSNAGVQCETEFLSDTRPLAADDAAEVSVDAHATRNNSWFLFRLPPLGLSYVEMVFPSDLESTGARWRGGRLNYRVMCEPLEKGVIRKARLRGLVIPTADDESVAERAFEAFALEAPPLAT